jgi:hypothetical protein
MNTKFICCKCNQPVNQPCCSIEAPKLKKGVLPFGCPFGIASPIWKRESAAQEKRGQTFDDWLLIHKSALAEGAFTGESLQRFMRISWDAALSRAI